MMHVASCGLILLVMTFSQAGQICELITFRVTTGVMLPNSLLTKLSSAGKIRCVRACLSRQECKSVNYKPKFKEYQLNNRTVLPCHELSTDTDYVFFDNSPPSVSNVSGCLRCPAAENGHFNYVPDVSPIGATLSLICDPGNMPQGEVVCQGNGTWSSPVCASVSCCSMVKQYQPTSLDGEYWLRLTNFDNYTTLIYCHNMQASSPEELLTLPNINYGIYPRIMNRCCSGQDYQLTRACKGQGGEIRFNKIKVNIATMGVSKEDRTFVTISNKGYALYYATAYDCYTHHRGNALRCGIKGRFTIDLRGTGWKVSEGQQWGVYGYAPMIESIDRQMNGTLIQLRCGGFGGGCRPIGGLYLTLHP